MESTQDLGGGGASSSSGKERRKKRRLKNEPQSFIGADDGGPSGVNVLEFVEARSTEINTMQRALAGKGGGKRVFQTLPRHMRRRAMSHNPKRLPRRLQEAATKEMEAADSQAKKPACRRRRRKPSVMRMASYRKKHEFVRLETHLWHAKRMHMVNKHGHRFARHCNNKGFRAMQRSLKLGCLMSDISYCACYEIAGEQSEIIRCLAPLFNIDTGLTIKAKAYINGQREGKAILYKAGTYPRCAIAPVHFLWQAPPPRAAAAAAGDRDREGTGWNVASNFLAGQEGQKLAKLWIWCYPESQMEVHSALRSSVQSSNRAMLHSAPQTPDDQMVPNTVQPVRPRPPPALTLTQRDLLRFRLIGPRSHAILMDALKPAWNNTCCADSGCSSGGSSAESEDDVGLMGKEDSSSSSSSSQLPHSKAWWLGKEVEPCLREHAKTLSTLYQAVKSAPDPASFSRGCVIGLCVEDPRLYTPSKKTYMVASSSEPEKNKEQPFTNSNFAAVSAPLTSPSFCCSSSSFPCFPASLPPSLPPELAYSPIWDPATCSVVSESKIPDHLLNKKRSKKLVRSSSSRLRLGKASPRVPVLLIQQFSGSGRGARGGQLGVGWDLVLPAEWGMAFWVALYYRGARVCCAEELSSCSVESRVLHFPQDFPDTGAGHAHRSALREAAEEEYRKRPPQNRLDLGRLLVPAAFYIPWEELVRCWRHRIAPVRAVVAAASGFETSEEEEEEDVDDDDGDDSYGDSIPCKRLKLESDGEVSAGDAWLGEDSCFGVEKEEECSMAEVEEVEEGGFYVLRSREDLASLKLFAETVLATPTSATVAGDNDLAKTDNALQTATFGFGIDSILAKHSNAALVAVVVEIHRAGCIGSMDSLSLPSPLDFQSLLAADANAGSESFSGPEERVNGHGLTVVGNEGIVVGVSALAKRQIKDLKRGKKKNGVVTASDFRLLPVRPSRETIGYVTSANYLLTTSLSTGVGFVALPALLEAIKCCSLAGVPHLLALARGKSTQYYFVKVSLLL